MVGLLRPKKPQVREHLRSIGKALENRAKLFKPDTVI